MNVVQTRIPGVLIVEPRVHADERGHFFEAWRRDRYREAGIDVPMVQDNVSFSRRGVLRGLHFQDPNPQAKLVSVLVGAVWDVAVDLRAGSPAFGESVGVELSAENRRQLFIPEGCAHGFVVTGESALLFYKCSALYDPESERTIRWDDPELNISWPAAAPTLSTRDARAPFLRDVSSERLPERTPGAQAIDRAAASAARPHPAGTNEHR
jgi:dTDP-4-dehydrorhamnose 3,5-epimerase